MTIKEIREKREAYLQGLECLGQTVWAGQGIPMPSLGTDLPIAGEPKSCQAPVPPGLMGGMTPEPIIPKRYLDQANEELGRLFRQLQEEREGHMRDRGMLNRLLIEAETELAALRARVAERDASVLRAVRAG